MFDFSALMNNSEDPSVYLILLTVLFSFFLSGMIVFTYEMTTRGTARPDNFIQALLLVAIVASTVIQAIGDSLARGLGMLGALSIIRFRTTLRNPRNIVFMFSSLATGIACGVYGFEIAFIGTLGFCLTAFILYLTPFSKRHDLIGSLRLELNRDSGNERKVYDILKKGTKKYALSKYTIYNRREKIKEPAPLPPEEDGVEQTPVLVKTKKDGVASYEYSITLFQESDAWELTDALYEIDGVENVRLNFEQKDENELV